MRRPSRKLRPDLERFEARDLPGAGLMDGSGLFGNPRGQAGRQQLRPPQIGSIALVPDVGLLVPPFGQVRVDSARLVPGTAYNLSSLTVRNGTSQTFDSRSGLSAKPTGRVGFQPFLRGNDQWKPGGLVVFYVLSRSSSLPTFTFNLDGSIEEKPANLTYDIRYNPATFPATLDAVAARSVGARYRLA